MKDEFEVLLLEKSEQNIERIKDTLKNISFDLGYTVCTNKKATTAYLSEDKPDIIICNNQLPDLDGREALALSKKMHPHVPFILISDLVGEEKAVDAMLEGADDFITTDNLERLGPAIQRELANYIAYNKAKQERDELKDNLEERVKEQKCLYNISSLNEHKLSVDELLNEAVSLIPAGFQDPNATEAEIRFNGEVFQTGDFGDEAQLLNKRISLNTGEEVNVKIGCAGGQAKDAEEQFLFEEKKLLVALANILAQKLNQIHINEELNRQHDFLTEAYNVARIGHWELDLEAETLYWSDMVKKIHEVPLDYKPTLEEAIDFYRGDDRKKMEALVMDIIQNGGSYREDLKITTAKGNKRWVRVTGHAKSRKKGKPRIYGTSQDITDRKKVEEQLRKSEQRYQSLFEKNHAVMLLIDPQEDEILDANPAAEKFYGYSTEELRGMSVSDINTLSTDEVKAEMKNAVSENKKYFEFKHQLASGEVRDVVVYTGPITMGSEDLLYSIIYDNTQRKEAEKELRKLSAATEQSPALILITDKEGIIEYVNPKFAEVCGYDRDELIGENPNILNSGKHADAFYEEMWTTIKKGNTFRGEVTNQKKDGEYYDVLQQIAPIYNDEGDITHFLSVQEDITKRKKNERKLKKSLDEKRVLLSEIHHRVKNNLAVVSGIMQLQAMDEEDTAMQETLLDNVARIQSMATIHELLYQSETFSNLNFAEAIKQVAHNVLENAQRDIDIDISFDIPSLNLNINQALPTALVINEVVSNIAKHAFKDRREGNIDISISERNNEITLQVIDDGRELPDEFYPHQHHSMGMELINTLTQQLEGDYTYKRNDDQTIFELRFMKRDTKGAGNASL